MVERMTEKSFYKGTTRYSFQYEPDASDPNPASDGTFSDEESIRARFYYPYIKAGDVVFDIGASFGSYTLPALALGAKVYAFSPEHEYPLIKRNIEINNYPQFPANTSPFVFPLGIYSKRGYFKTDSAEFSEQDRRKETEGKWTGWWIPVTTLDDFVNEDGLDRLDYLKIDTEGAELEVLKGGIETIKKYKPKMLLEAHLFKDENMGQKLIDFLEPLGYKLNIQPYTNAVSHCFAWM
jgi:FkbM family methyltransferase